MRGMWRFDSSAEDHNLVRRWRLGLVKAWRTRDVMPTFHLRPPSLLAPDSYTPRTGAPAPSSVHERSRDLRHVLDRGPNRALHDTRSCSSSGIGCI